MNTASLPGGDLERYAKWFFTFLAIALCSAGLYAGFEIFDSVNRPLTANELRSINNLCVAQKLQDIGAKRKDDLIIASDLSAATSFCKEKERNSEVVAQRAALQQAAESIERTQ